MALSLKKVLNPVTVLIQEEILPKEKEFMSLLEDLFTLEKNAFKFLSMLKQQKREI